MASHDNARGNPVRCAPSPAVDGFAQYGSSDKRRDNDNDCDIHLSAISAGADSPVAASEFASSISGIESVSERTPKRCDLHKFDSPPFHDIEFKFTTSDEQGLGNSPADQRFYKELKQQLRERRRELVTERRLLKQKIKHIDLTYQSLRNGQIRHAMQVLQYRRETDVQSTASTEGTTPPTSPTRSPTVGTDPKKVDKTKETKNKVTELLKEVRNIEWTVFSGSRRNGLYTGSALNGKIPHGTGTFLFTNSDVYEGPFKYGIMQGHNGVLKSASGSKYNGEFLKNLKHGSGEEVFANGSRYVGKYYNGLQHGFGVQYNEDGTVFYLGQWEEGKPARKIASEPDEDVPRNADELELSKLEVTEGQLSRYLDSKSQSGVVLQSNKSTWVWSSNMNDADIPYAFDTLSDDDGASMYSSDSSCDGKTSKYSQY